MNPRIKEIAAELVGQVEHALANGGMWKSANMSHGLRLPSNALTKRRYTGINAVTLWMAQQEKVHWSNQWITFKQKCEIEARRGKPMMIRKGEKATTGLKVKDFIPAEFKPEGDRYRSTKTGDLVSASSAKRRFWKTFSVFNLAQFEELPEEVAKKPDNRPAEPRTLDMLQFYHSLGPSIRPGNECAYTPALDYIVMPPREYFTDDNRYCSTLSHEMTHWTGHPSRLDRKQIGATGSVEGMAHPDYCFEELVAEIGALLMCAEFGVPPMMAHALYAAHYVKNLKAWPEAIVDAASKADAAVRWMLEKGGRLAATPDAGEVAALSSAA